MSSSLVLYSYWRSSAAFRVRIALNLKGLHYETRAVHLVRDGGEQHSPEYVALNPQQLVPVLVDGDKVMTQSMAIAEYLDETHPHPPLLPADAAGKARVRAMAQIVGCDIHPIGNLRVLQQIGSQFGADDEQKSIWMRHWIAAGFQALETVLANSKETGRYCHGDTPGLADLCLVPQVYNARRWKTPLEDYPTILRIDAACMELDAFKTAMPEQQPDAPK
ncbi:maleylacetoacetate isomerase [Dyella nitratireducens]|uniref:Maleylacetoacetate isomerase n=1 Tax=Dyella nitratireducens TaxID=1849580 RepID=A0ABQ1GWF3_9GAMM|nr:maleylacetoacetate isomerase [Dyella nitratireducens]GGA51140.1 maleylacetoacetate isomerase [Dyella nitratireducens]GLQ42688.1 maleylacetoacetate isomerase [Dyella nitratireducens]